MQCVQITRFLSDLVKYVNEKPCCFQDVKGLIFLFRFRVKIDGRLHP